MAGNEYSCIILPIAYIQNVFKDSQRGISQSKLMEFHLEK